jgi:curved DNA-binding protein CbpA
VSPIRDPDASANGAYYRRLEVGRGASHDEIVRAYRRLALGAHPDAHPEDPEASLRFRELTEAYEVLGDPVRRNAYDGNRPSHRIPVHHRDATGASAEGSPNREAQPSARPIVLGASRQRLTGEVPLRVGPVHLGSPSGTNGDAAGSVAFFFEILDSWWGRW